MKKALITGISGMVGSHLLDYLLEETSWNVVGLIRWRSSLDNLDKSLRSSQKNRITFAYGDIRDANALSRVVKEHKPDYVFHLAAQSFPKVSFDCPEETLQINAVGTANLLEAIRLYSPDAVTHVCSSSEVFGRVPAHLTPISEDTPFHPASPYAISKVVTDQLGRFYSEAYGLNTQVTRMFTHTGPRRGDVFAESSFAKQIALAESGIIPPTIHVGNLDSLRTVADVRDAVHAYYEVVTNNPLPGNYFNIGGTHTLTVGEILNFLIELSPIKKFSIVVDQSRLRPIDADLQVPNMTKFQKHTGWKPMIGFEETMLDLLNYWRSEIARGRVVINR